MRRPSSFRFEICVRVGVLRSSIKLWHAFIVFTKEYARFCSEAVGFFVHHVPRTKREGLDGSPYETYARTLAAYERVFGEPAPREIWPRYPDKGIN
jgi:hypothetical protein